MVTTEPGTRVTHGPDPDAPSEPVVAPVDGEVDGEMGGAVDPTLPLESPSESRRLPRWVVPSVVVFWGGFLAALALRFFWGKLNGLFVLLAISVFLSLAVEPGVNRLARRGWRRGTATALILFGVFATSSCSSSPSGRSSARRSPTSCRTPRRTSPTRSTRSTTRSAPTSTPRR